MHHLLPAGTHLYRVTDIARNWHDVISGVGSYYNSGGRYNRTHQRTVYAATRARVAIAETAVHIAMDRWQPRIGQGHLGVHEPLPRAVPPLVSEHWLWESTIDNDMQLIRVEDPIARATFQHRLYESFNPSQAYRRTADLADAIRMHPHPNIPNAFVEGILAPSVRAPPVGKNAPRQEVLFVPANPPRIASTLVQRWRMALEFGDKSGQSVTVNTRVIDWARPWFRLTDNAAAAQAFAANAWHQSRVKYT
jgi:hypothetical protein